MLHPPRILHGPLEQSTTSSHVVPSSSHTFVSKAYVPPSFSTGYVPPYMFGVQLPYQSYNYGYVAPRSQGILNYNIPMYPFMGQARGGYYPTSQGHGV